MLPRKLIWGVPLAIGAAGCGSTKMTPSGPEQEARDPACEFRVFTTAPAGGYAEIAAIDVQPGGYGHKMFTDIADFKEEIRPSVCQAGGDAVIAYANGYGMYIKATVLKELPEAAKPTVASTSGAPAAQAPSIPQDGCRYDTQCKGERVCVNGECVDPTPPAATAPPVATAPTAASAAPGSAVSPVAPAPTAAPQR